MPVAQPAIKPALRPILSIVLLIVGIALIAWSFIWASIATGSSTWSQEQARKYQAAATKLHSLSHQYAQEAARGNEAAVRDDLDKARAEYQSLRGELESAIGRPRYIAWMLRLAGLLLLIGGVVSLLMLPAPSPGRS